MSRLIWALFGNDDDPYGVFPHTCWGRVRQWRRNPFHNLCWHVWRKEGGWFIERGGIPGWWFYFGHRPWTKPKGAFGFKLTYELNKI